MGSVRHAAGIGNAVSRNCPVCGLPRLVRGGVDDRLARNEPLGQIARDVGLTINQLAHHRREGHTKNQAVAVIGTPDSYHGDLDFVHQELLNLLADFESNTCDKCGKMKDPAKRDALTCLKEIRNVVEAKAKLAGAYNQGSDARDPRLTRLVQLFSAFAVKHPEVKEEMLLLLDEAQFEGNTG
jgi:hypothetical protein